MNNEYDKLSEKDSDIDEMAEMGYWWHRQSQVTQTEKEVDVLRKIDNMSYHKLIQEPIAVDPTEPHS